MQLLKAFVLVLLLSSQHIQAKVLADRRDIRLPKIHAVNGKTQPIPRLERRSPTWGPSQLSDNEVQEIIAQMDREQVAQRAQQPVRQQVPHHSQHHTPPRIQPTNQQRQEPIHQQSHQARPGQGSAEIYIRYGTNPFVPPEIQQRGHPEAIHSLAQHLHGFGHVGLHPQSIPVTERPGYETSRHDAVGEQRPHEPTTRPRHSEQMFLTPMRGPPPEPSSSMHGLAQFFHGFGPVGLYPPPIPVRERPGFEALQRNGAGGQTAHQSRTTSTQLHLGEVQEYMHTTPQRVAPSEQDREQPQEQGPRRSRRIAERRERQQQQQAHEQQGQGQPHHQTLLGQRHGRGENDGNDPRKRQRTE